MCISQNLPVNPGWQWQKYSLTPSTQIPLFTQGSPSQSFKFSSQFRPASYITYTVYTFHSKITIKEGPFKSAKDPSFCSVTGCVFFR